MPVSTTILTLLPVTRADLKRLCALDPGDTAFDAALDAMQDAEQGALEYALDPALLAAAGTDPGLASTLTLGVTEVLAGRFLQAQARAPGATDDFQVGPLKITASRTDSLAQAGARLALTGASRLAPFSRAPRRVALDAAADRPDASTWAQTLGASVSASPSLFDNRCDTGCDSSCDTGWEALP